MILAHPVDRTVSVGTTAHFSVTAAGAALRYQWRRDGVPVTGATGAVHSVAATTADDGVRFDVVVANDGGAQTSEAATLRVNAAAVRTPVAGHPRLWIREQDLARLRSWATAGNPMYGAANGGALYQLAVTARDRIESGVVPAQDNGGSTYTPYATESYAALMALMGLLDTDPVRNPRWIAAAKTALFAVIDQADLGVGAGKFRSGSFASSDRGRWHGEAFPLAVDWLYPSLSASEKRRIRRVFLRWCAEDRDGYPSVTYYHTNAGSVPSGTARRNNPALLDLQDPKRRAIRFSMNNYLMAHARNIFMMANAIDPGDDIADPTVPGDANGRLGDFMHEAIGTYLYMTDYAYRNDGFGGISPEGMEYGESIGFYYGLMLALHTSGMDDTTLHGDKVSLVNHPLLTRLMPGFFHSLTTRKVATGYGQVLQPSWFGDAEQLYFIDPMRVMGPLSLYARYAGRSQELAAAKWLEYTAPPDNPGRLTSRAGNDDNIIQSIFYFLMFDPGEAPPADPRPSTPTHHFAASLGRLQARTSWNDAADVRMLNTKLSYNAVDHQHGDGNMFDFWRKGEWLTKELSAYGAGAALSEFKNTLTIQNDPQAAVGNYHAPFLARGSQFIGSAHDGDPKVLVRGVASDYLLFTGDATNLYNYAGEDGDTARGVSHASRSLMWLKPDTIVVMDRARTASDGRFKRFWLNLPSHGAAPVRSGATVTASTPGGQRLHVSTLLPEPASASAAIVGPAIDVTDQFWKATLDPMSADKISWTGAYRLRVEAVGHPRSVHFLHVLQGTDGSVAAQPTQLLRSDQGSGLTGALVGSTAVLFVDDLYAALASSSIVVPATATRVLVTGLAPDGAYTVDSAPVSGGRRLTLSAGGSLRANALGVLEP
ncbi:hypothetical protein [Piscinibacter sp. XHJ-5]|uniref:hypothetical protein n=1 Tax=Piscinibacter sp. XHJ-5 TaxID=3037797 RepID=UPI0024533D8F|nr:hypothetical protein [Piscinibacter sp. XHJ-5]